MWRPLRFLFFLLIVHPIVLIVLGLNVRRRALLPQDGPAIIAANHNSHLDALVLMTVLGMRRLPKVRPVAAADFFLRTKWLAWFAMRIIGIIPLERHARGAHCDPLARTSEALERGNIIILFPEGTRGEPERLAQLRNGIAHLSKRHPEVPITPVFIHGLGKALPRGEALLVPFFCDLFVGEPLVWTNSKQTFMQELDRRMKLLADEAEPPAWD